MELDLDVPEKNDILDEAKRMLSEVEALRAIAGVTEEEKKENDGNPESEVKPSDTQNQKVPKERVSNPSSKLVKKTERRKASVKEESEPDKYFRFQLTLPKEYGIKCRLIHAGSSVDLLNVVRQCVLDSIDKIWDENKDAIQANVTRVFN